MPPHLSSLYQSTTPAAGLSNVEAIDVDLICSEQLSCSVDPDERSGLQTPTHQHGTLPMSAQQLAAMLGKAAAAGVAHFSANKKDRSPHQSVLKPQSGAQQPSMSPAPSSAVHDFEPVTVNLLQSSLSAATAATMPQTTTCASLPASAAAPVAVTPPDLPAVPQPSPVAAASQAAAGLPFVAATKAKSSASLPPPLPAEPPAADSTPARAVQACKDVESLAAYGWDRRALKHPPNMKMFEPSQAKRRTQGPLRFIEEPDRPQHACRASCHGKRQKLDHHTAAPCANQPVDSWSKRARMLSQAHAESDEPSLPVQSGSRAQALCTSTQLTTCCASSGLNAQSVPCQSSSSTLAPAAELPIPQIQDDLEASSQDSGLHSKQLQCSEHDSIHKCSAQPAAAAAVEAPHAAASLPIVAAIRATSSASLPPPSPAEPPAADSMPARTVRACKEVESLAAYGWDRESLKHPPKMQTFEPSQAKRRPQGPLRFIEEPDRPQHACRASCNGKRQKLDHYTAAPSATQQVDFCFKRSPTLLHAHAQSDGPSLPAQSDSRLQALCTSTLPQQQHTTCHASSSHASSSFSAQSVACPSSSFMLAPAAELPIPQVQDDLEASLQNPGLQSKQQHSGHDSISKCNATSSSGLFSTQSAALCQSSMEMPTSQHIEPAEYDTDQRFSAADHTIYTQHECCCGKYPLNVDVRAAASLPAALLPNKLEESKLQGRLLWGAMYPVEGNRLGVDEEYKRCHEFLKSQFERDAQIVLPGIRDVFQAVAYSSAHQQASKTKPWVRCEGLSTSGQFTLWHEPPIRRSRPQKNIISSMIFHLRETPARGNAAPTLYTGSCQHAIVEVMFVATKVEHRKKKFFVQLLRLFMREYLLKHYQHVDLLVMATPRTAQEWSTDKLARQLDTQAFQRMDDQHPLVLGREKCTDCNWLHLAIDQSLLRTADQ